MRILYLITKSEAGGAQTHLAQLVEHFIDNRNSVAVMSYPGGWLQAEVEKTGAAFIANQYFANSYNPFRALKAMAQIRKAVAEFKPELIACHSSVASFLGRLAIRRKVPTVFTAHGWGFNDYTNIVSRCIAVVAEKIAAHYSDRIICVSEFIKNLALIHRIGSPEKFEVIYNGIEDPEGGLIPVGEKHPKIVFVGRLAEPKEPEILVKAYSSLSSEVKLGSELLIVGDGPKKSKLEKLAKKNAFGPIRFLGALPRKEILRIYGEEAAIFVLASKWESFGLTALEAMRHGVPVIVSRAGGLKEVVDVFSGLTVDKSDVKEMAEALKKLLNNRELRIRLGAGAEKRAREKFSLSLMLSKTENLYKSVLKAALSVPPVK